MQYLSRRGLKRCVHDVAIGTNFYSHQGIVVDKVMDSNLLIGYKHGKEIYVIERFVIHLLFKGIISCLWVHAGARLDVYGKEILHFCGYWKMILFQWLRPTLILVDHETGCVGTSTSLSFHSYKEHPNWRSYTSGALIWRKVGPGLLIENKYVK
jgi:hypothetical protein